MSGRLHFPESRAEARSVVENLLDADPDAFDPRAELDRLVPSRCPDCGGTNLSAADDEGLIDCLDCGVWFNPLHPRNAPGVAGNFPDPSLWKDRPVHEAEDDDDDDDADGITDYKAYAMQHGRSPRITITFARTTPESAENGEYSDSGWIDVEGEDMTPDPWDMEEGLTAVDKAVKFMALEGVSEASSSHFHPGVWWSTESQTIDYATGESEERSYHLKDFTPEEEKEIWDKMKYRP